MKFANNLVNYIIMSIMQIYLHLPCSSNAVSSALVVDLMAVQGFHLEKLIFVPNESMK